MPDGSLVVIIGGTSGIGLEIARHFVAEDRDVVLSGRDAERARSVAAELGGRATGIGFDLAEPGSVRERLSGLGDVEHLVLAAIDRDDNRVREYDPDSALRLVTLKLVGYSAVVHALAPRLGADSSVVVFGGQAKERPYPGSTTISTINAGVDGLVRTLAVEVGAGARERDPSRHRRRQPGVAVAPRGRARRDPRAHADRAARTDGRHRRRGRVPVDQPVDQRHQPGSGRGLDAALTASPVGGGKR